MYVNCRFQNCRCTLNLPIPLDKNILRFNLNKSYKKVYNKNFATLKLTLMKPV